MDINRRVSQWIPPPPQEPKAATHACSIAEIVSLILELRWRTYRDFERESELGYDYPAEEEGDMLSRPRPRDSILDSILVSNLWVNEGLRILWRDGAHLGPRGWLTKMPNFAAIDEQRWAYYADMVQTLTVDIQWMSCYYYHTHTSMQLLQDHPFPILREVTP